MKITHKDGLSAKKRTREQQRALRRMIIDMNRNVLKMGIHYKMDMATYR